VGLLFGDLEFGFALHQGALIETVDDAHDKWRVEFGEEFPEERMGRDVVCVAQQEFINVPLRNTAE